jgi:hypothetical protein
MGSREWALTSDTPEIDAGSSDDQAGMPIRTGFRDDNRAELDDVSDVIDISAAAPRRGSRPVARDSLSVTGVGDSTVIKLEDHKQLVLQKACRRIGKSSSGSKSMLAHRLCNSSFDCYGSVEQLARNYELIGTSVSDEAARKRSPNRTENETTRLAHVPLVDPSNSTALTHLFSRASREQLDVCLHDPWSEELVALLNNPKFVPEVPEIAGGAVKETLGKFDPG